MFNILHLIILTGMVYTPDIHVLKSESALIPGRKIVNNGRQLNSQNCPSLKDLFRSKFERKSPEMLLERQDPYEPNNTPATAYLITYGDTLTQGIVEPAGDEDYFKFAGNVGDTVTIDIDASIYGSWLDSYLELYDTDSVTLLAWNDDWNSLDSRIMNFILSSNGVYFIKVTDLGSNGGPEYFYQIWVTDIPVPVGWISGTITDSITGQPLPDIYVEVYDTAYMYSGYSFTDGSGFYLTNDLEPGIYKVMSNDWTGYMNKWFDNKLDFFTADTVRVIGHDTTLNIDFQLSYGACISGSITDSATGQPIADVTVDVYDTSYNYISGGYTDYSGSYIVAGLTSGVYKLTTWAMNGYINEWFDNRLDFNTADTVRVNVPDTTFNIDFELSLGGLISGTVTDSLNGQPLMDVFIDVYDLDYNYVSWAFTDASGDYITYTGLRSGSYKLVATDFGSGAYEWYRNRTDFIYADPVNVVMPDTTENIDFDLYLTGIAEDQEQGKQKRVFYEIAPNPARANITIRFAIDFKSGVSIQVYNILGQKVATLFDAVCQNGDYCLRWWPEDDSGNELARGVYFIELVTERERTVRKVIIIN